MSIDEIEAAISNLGNEDLRRLRVWFEEHDAELWDRHLVEDVGAGKLDSLADQAIRELDAGDAREL